MLSVVGIKPIGKYQHSYKNVWLWGSFSPITGDKFIIETPFINNEIFETYLREFSKVRPRELKLLIMDNASFHTTKNIELPNNIKLINIPPYTPELNPAEKVWEWMKDQTAMKIYPTIEDLQEKIDEMVEKLDADIVKSITGYQIYLDAFSDGL